MYTQTSTAKKSEYIKSEQNSTESWNQAYKVYANLDYDRDKKNCALEVIDGYLKSGEILKLNGTSRVTSRKIKVFHFEVASNHSINTYFRSNSFEFLAEELETFLVCIYRKKQLVGYQYFDHQNNLIGEPPFNMQELLSGE